MTAPRTILCIHREPAQLSLLQDNGYELVTASNGGDGLRLFMSRPVDAIVMEYHLGLLDGTVIANEIKQVRPEIPIIMLTEDLELPDGALNSVDAIVTKDDGPHFLWATVHFVLNVQPARPRHGGAGLKTAHLRLSGRLAKNSPRMHKPVPEKTDNQAAPFSPRVWSAIRNGSIRF